MNRPIVIAVVATTGVLLVASFVQFDGPVRPVNCNLVTQIHRSATWYSRPTVAASDSDPGALYVVGGLVGGDTEMEAVRVDVRSGEQTRSQVGGTNQTVLRFFKPAAVHAAVTGIRFQRPALHLMKFPTGKGPGIHLTDSATGRVKVVLDGAAGRVLLTRNVFNSSGIAALLSLVVVDPEGAWIAALSRRPSADWTLYLFSQAPTRPT